MKTCKHLTYTRKIQWRIRALWLLLTGMLVYMVLIAELGGGDSRMMTPLADKFSRIVFISDPRHASAHGDGRGMSGRAKPVQE